jgi:hypothetical protein
MMNVVTPERLLFTALCAASVPAFVQMWRGESTAATLPRYRLSALIKFREDRVRAGLAAMVSAYVLCLTGWMLPFVRSATHTSAAALVLVLVLSGTCLASFVSIATVVLFNRPKFLVPPRLRRQWGSIKARRTQKQRYRGGP